MIPEKRFWREFRARHKKSPDRNRSFSWFKRFKKPLNSNQLILTMKIQK